MNAREIAELLSAHHLRPTQQRIAVYQYLDTHRTHPTADTIYQALVAQFPTFSRTTIYNSLHSLADAGLIRTVNIEAEEQRFDGNAADHGHFRCRCCGRLFDFDIEQQALKRMCPPGFQAEVQDVFLNGVCADCADCAGKKVS